MTPDRDDTTKSMAAPVIAGSMIGVYRIEGPLGEGGMGVVYKATDTKLNRPAAVKLLSNELADAAARRRFQTEAQTASSLNHPHIVTVYDVGEYQGRQYLVTEFIDGGTLKQWSRAERRTWRQVVELLTGVADGLATAHSAGILHRDIKPDNILITKSGYAKLADFGLAKLAQGDVDLTGAQEGLTKPGMIIGTIPYMSPEQASGQKVDQRSDIFSIGAVLYETLGGRKPFEGGSNLEVLQKVIHAEPAALSEDLPQSLRWNVEKALEKDVQDRYQTMGDLVVDLRTLARNRGKAAVPAASKPAGWRGIALPAALAAVAVAGAGYWIGSRGRTEAINLLAPPAALFSKLTDFPGMERDAIISPDGRFVAFLSDRSGAVDLWITQVGTGRFTNLTQGNEPNLDSTLRAAGFTVDGAEVWYHNADIMGALKMVSISGGQPRVFLSQPPIHATPPSTTTPIDGAWSPDGSRFLYHTSDPNDPMFLADRTGGNSKQIFISQNQIHNHFPAWSPDGAWIYLARGVAATAEMDVWRMRPAGGEPERLTKHNTAVSYPAPIGDGTVLYIAREQDGSGPWLWELDVNAKTSRRLSFGLEKYTSVAASADGRRLVATSANPRASLSSVPLRDPVAAGPAEEKDVRAYPLPVVRALAPRFGGTTALYFLSSKGTGDGLWRVQGDQALELWKGAEGGLVEPAAVSPDGNRVAFALPRDGRITLHVMTKDGSDVQAMAGSIDVRGAPEWSPDGKWIVTGGSDSDGQGLFKIPIDGGKAIQLAKGVALNPVWSPTGDVIVYAGPNPGLSAPLLAVSPEGQPIGLPDIQVRRDGARARFLHHGNRLVYMQGVSGAQDFWLLDLDLATKKPQRLTRLSSLAGMRSFDITPDDKQIVFDRLEENSDIVLIDLRDRAN